VSFATITLCFTFQRVFIVVSVYFVMIQSGNFWIRTRTSIPPYVFMVCSLIKHRDNFTFICLHSKQLHPDNIRTQDIQSNNFSNCFLLGLLLWGKNINYKYLLRKIFGAHKNEVRHSGYYTTRNFMIYTGHSVLFWHWNTGGYDRLGMWIAIMEKTMNAYNFGKKTLGK